MPRVAGSPAREQPAKVAHPRRGQQRVADRVERGIAIGVAVEPGRFGDLDAAQAQARRVPKGWLSAPRRSARRACSRPVVRPAPRHRAHEQSRSAGSVTLSVLGLAGDRGDRDAVAFEQRRLVAE